MISLVCSSSSSGFPARKVNLAQMSWSGMALSKLIWAGPSSSGIDDITGRFGEDMVLGGCCDVGITAARRDEIVAALIPSLLSARCVGVGSRQVVSDRGGRTRLVACWTAVM